MEITKSLCAITAEIGALGKTKKNQQQGYAFRGVDDLMNCLHPYFAKYGVIVVPEVLESTREERVTAKGSALLSAILKVRYHFTAIDGSEVCATVIGEGMDSGDKASNKALAVAYKYACFQVFCIPTEEIKAADPDYYTPDASLSANRVIKERLLKCASYNELKDICTAYGGTIQADESLLILYRSVKSKLVKGARQ